MIVYLFALLLFIPQTLTCPLNYCIDCLNATGDCLECEPYFGLYPHHFSPVAKCYPCVIDHCFNCDGLYVDCVFCEHGFGIEKINNTILCSECRPIDNCVMCSRYNVSRCGFCVSLYGLDADRQCRPCLDTKCEQCKNNYAICKRCKEGYGVSSSKACIRCHQDCLNCSINAYNCTQCKGGFYLDSPQNETCRKCHVPYCSRCSDDVSICHICEGIYGMSSHNSCEVCEIYNCVYCWYNKSLCHYCGNGFGVSNFFVPSYGLQCVPCKTNCKMCNLNASSCTQCLSPFFLENSQCVQCQYGCAHCTNSSICLQCFGGYYLLDGSCFMCYYKCTECQSFQICVSCISGFHILIKYQFPYCDQICGDGTVYDLSCDNKIGVDYDGCDNECEVMSNFQCQTVNDKSICSYVEQIEMKVVSFDSLPAPEYNSFVAVLKVHPPLHVFSQQLSKQLFTIKNSQFQIQSIKFDNLTSQFTILLKLITKFEQSDITVIFTPSDKINKQFFATPNATISISLIEPLIFVEYVPFINIFFYICCAICVLAWIDFVLGIVLKRLEGLQAMMTVQFCWISFIWTDNDFIPPFQSFLPFRYSIGYPLKQLITTGSSVVISPLFVGQLQMKPQLSNNFGVSICCCLLFLTFGTIAFIVFKRATQNVRQMQKSDNANQNDAKESLQTKKSIFDLSMQILFQFILFSLCYFIFCSVLLFKNSSSIDTISIVIFCLFTAIFAMVCLIFYFDPNPFSYFRYSFHPKPVPMNHYFFQILVISLSVILVLFLSSLSYLTFIPLGLMTIFTLITRPYKQTLSNYRSFFNYLVMSSFVGFKIYLSKINTDELWEKNTFLYLVGESGLLLIVTVLGLVCLIVFKVLEVRGNQKVLEDNEIQNLILQDLVATDVHKKMGAVNHNGIFKNFVSPNMKLLTLSNSLSRKNRKGSMKDREVGFDEVDKKKRMFDPIMHDNLNWQTNFEIEQMNTADQNSATKERKRKQSLIENVLENENSYVQFKAVLEKTVLPISDSAEVSKSEERPYLQIYEQI